MSSWKTIIPITPLLISTTLKHFLKGPPHPSWDLKLHLSYVMLKSMLVSVNNLTIEEMQDPSTYSIPIPDGMMINEFKIGNKYRYEAQVHLEKILKSYEHVLDSEWKDLKDDGITSEWVQVPNDGWEKREIRKTILYLHGGAYYLCSRASHRNITCKLAEQVNARVLVIDYRLAPQNQFPAGLQDALAAYLYLLNPPKDAGFEPLNPENIVISGDSAGGGLSMALGLAIRDAGLPSCAGINCWCPWVDLSISMPSMISTTCTDYLPYPGTGFIHKESPVSIDFKEKAAALTAKIKKQNGPKVWHDTFDRSDGRIHLYAPNESIAVPYVSPMLAESLGNLPPLLLVAGGEERLRDEIIYLAYRSAEPTKYKGPSYNIDKFEKSPFKNPTNVTLEVYEEMPHVFQMFDHPSAVISCNRTVEFMNRVLETPSESLPPSSFNRISGKGEVIPVNEHYKEVLEWKEVGIIPNISREVEAKAKNTSLKLTRSPEILVYIVLLFAIISYFA